MRTAFGIPVTWSDSGGSKTLTLANLASGTGRLGAQKDWGLGPIEGKYSVRVRVRAATTPLVGGILRIYLATAQDTQFIAGGLPTTDTLITDERQLANCQLLGQLKVDEASTTKDFVAEFPVQLDSRCVSPVIFNALGVPLDATPANNEVAIWPIVQGGATAGTLIPGSIDATGVTDVSAPLQAFFDSVPDGTRILGPAGAIYRPEFGIVLSNRNGLTLEAQDPALPPTLLQTVLEPYGIGHANNRSRAVLEYLRGGEHTLRDWRLHGAQPNSGYNGVFTANLEAQHGLEIAAVTGMLVEDVFITEVAGDFVYLSNNVVGVVNTLCDGVTIRRVTGRKCSRQGMAVTGSTHILVEDCDLQDITRSAFDCEPPASSGTIDGLMVRRSIFGLFRNSWVAGLGASAAIVNDLTFEDCEIIGSLMTVNILGHITSSGGSGSSLGGLRRSNIRIANNHAHSITFQPTGTPNMMVFQGIDGLDVSGNLLDFIGGATDPKQVGTAVTLHEVCGVTYSGNTWGNPVSDHKVTVGYNADGSLIQETNGANLEWPLCGLTVLHLAVMNTRVEVITIVQG